MRSPTFHAAVRAAAVAGIVSGIPSTAYCLATRRDPLEATIAAGAIVMPYEDRRSKLVLAAFPVHGAISLVWSGLLAAALPEKRTPLYGAFAGLGIAALDLGVLARFFPPVAALPRAPQIADHLAFGAIAGLVIARSRRDASDAARDRSVEG